MTLRDILAFLLGLATGGVAAGVYFTKKHNKEMDLVYSQIDHIHTRLETADGEGEADFAEFREKVLPKTEPRVNPNEKGWDRDPDDEEDVKEETDAGEEDDPNEVSEDGEEEPEIEDLEPLPGDEEEATDLDTLDLAETKARFKHGIDERQKEWDLAKTIFNISDNDYWEGEEDYDKLHITYHPSASSDEMYTDEHEEFITETDAKALIGTGLLFFGLRSGDKDLIYIRNKKIQADIEVSRAKE